jgi:hypothetical protein
MLRYTTLVNLKILFAQISDMTRLPCRSVTVACNTHPGHICCDLERTRVGAWSPRLDLVSGVAYETNHEKGCETDGSRHDADYRPRQPRPHSSSPSDFEHDRVVREEIVTGRRAKLPRRRHHLRKRTRKKARRGED